MRCAQTPRDAAARHGLPGRRPLCHTALYHVCAQRRKYSLARPMVVGPAKRQREFDTELALDHQFHWLGTESRIPKTRSAHPFAQHCHSQPWCPLTGERTEETWPVHTGGHCSASTRRQLWHHTDELRRHDGKGKQPPTKGQVLHAFQPPGVPKAVPSGTETGTVGNRGREAIGQGAWRGVRRRTAMGMGEPALNRPLKKVRWWLLHHVNFISLKTPGTEPTTHSGDQANSDSNTTW